MCASRACDPFCKNLYIFEACQSAFSHQRLMTEEVTSDNHSSWFPKSKRRWPCLSANRGGENGRVSSVNVLFFKSRWLLLLSQAHNFMPLKVPRGKEWIKTEGWEVGCKAKAVAGVSTPCSLHAWFPATFVLETFGISWKHKDQLEPLSDHKVNHVGLNYPAISVS